MKRESQPAPATPRPTRRAPRRVAGFLLVSGAVALLLVGASVVSRRMFERPARRRVAEVVARPSGAPGAPVVRPTAGSTAFRVAATQGTVEAFRDTRWRPIGPGDLLSVQDVVRTGQGARAVLRRGSSTELELREKVEVRLDRFSEEAASLDVLRGKVVANVAGNAESLEITARDTRSSNEGVARFVVSVDKKGKVAVASTAGTTRFAAAGKEVRLTEGTESHADPGRPPAEPEKIPDDVLLSVVWPEPERRGVSAHVHGQVGPNTEVSVNGTEVEVGKEGRWAATVPLREGANRIQVEAEEASGLRKSEANVIRRHSKAPPLTAEPQELWRR